MYSRRVSKHETVMSERLNKITRRYNIGAATIAELLQRKANRYLMLHQTLG